MPGIKKLASVWRAAAWWINGILGGHRYQQYLAHHQRHGHGRALSEREFWRCEYARLSREPAGRCC